jgi:crotonobetainyl-CoA:carnitine CoA-transferase CaiB-like acyl-CoA transferase
MLSGLRALDLTNEFGFFCGKILAQFGVDVIKIERPGGDPARNFGPFYHDLPDPEKSLYWFAFNESKRGITLNIETPEGQDIFQKLAKKADFVLESFPVGYMDKLGLGYQELSTINPGLIMTAITPFGQTGPYKDYKATDLIAMAMGGIMSLTGVPGGIPCRLSPNHAYCLAGANAALATMIAYYYRTWSGEGQYIDVALSECATRENYNEVPVSWEFRRYNAGRHGDIMFRYNVNTRTIWPCQDGHVTWTLFGGTIGATENKQLAKWLEEEGLLGDLKDIDWDQFGFDGITQEKIDQIEKPVFELLQRHTKKELEEESLKRGMRISAVNDVRDLYENRQLQFREYWKAIEHPELSEVVPYAGQLFISNETKTGPRHRAPLIGEHNQEIYEGELGFDSTTMAALKEKGVI